METGAPLRYVLRRAAEVYQRLIDRFAPQQKTNYVDLLNEWAVGFYTELDFRSEVDNLNAIRDVIVADADRVQPPAGAFAAGDGVARAAAGDGVAHAAAGDGVEHAAAPAAHAPSSKPALTSSAKTAVDGVYVPYAVEELCTARVAVTEWIDGVKLSTCEPAEIKRLTPVARRAVTTGRGDAAAATWTFRGDVSRRRRGCDVDIPW